MNRICISLIICMISACSSSPMVESSVKVSEPCKGPFVEYKVTVTGDAGRIERSTMKIPGDLSKLDYECGIWSTDHGNREFFVSKVSDKTFFRFNIVMTDNSDWFELIEVSDNRITGKKYHETWGAVTKIEKFEINR